MRLIQFQRAGSQQVALADDDGGSAAVLSQPQTIYELAVAAVAHRGSLATEAAARVGDERVDLAALAAAGALLPPITAPDPAHLWITGTGLTHLGSAAARDQMHQDAGVKAHVSDSMRMFQLGIEGGKPDPGTVGVQPEWFYKGNGTSLIAPEAPLPMPDFGLDGGEEPEIAGIYLIADDGSVCRLGFALGNEFSDHVMERQNYLYLAPSKLRACSIGPELLLGELPADIRGRSRILRNGTCLWEKEFITGETNMSHTIANLEYHHFKYPLFRQPGDVHVHFFGTATLSFTDHIRPLAGDVFEISAPPFTMPLRNPLVAAEPEPPRFSWL